MIFKGKWSPTSTECIRLANTPFHCSFYLPCVSSQHLPVNWLGHWCSNMSKGSRLTVLPVIYFQTINSFWISKISKDIAAWCALGLRTLSFEVTFDRRMMQYKSALEGLLSIHARGVLRGNLGPADNNSVGSSVIITEPSDAAVFVGFALGDFDCSNSTSFQSEMNFLHVFSRGIGKGKQLLDWGKNNLRKDLRRKKPKGNRL